MVGAHRFKDSYQICLARGTENILSTIETHLSALKPLLYPITIWTQVLERFCSQYCVDLRMDDRGSSVPYFRVLTGSSSGVGGRSRFSRPVQTVKEREVKAHRVTVPLA